MLKKYRELSGSELRAELESLMKKYGEYQAMGLKLDMSRGKPGAEQISISQDMLTLLDSYDDCKTADGFDCRNYGLPDGIPEAKGLFSELLGIPAKNIIVCGNSSLNLMFDAVSRAMTFGVPGSPKPWGKYEKIKFLCPVPGYDRHFAICKLFGIEMINIPMDSDGPDMDMIEKLTSGDETVKGVWCVPKYSNPDGVTYSDATVKRFAALKPAAPDFRIFWDNAYCVHDLYGGGDVLLNLFTEAEKYGNSDMVYVFASTSKISFPGAGIAAVCASDANVKSIKEVMGIQTIGHDKINQLRHVKYFKNLQGILDHMAKHAEFLRPKFDIVLQTLANELTPLGVGEWTAPRGGYFISFNLPDGCAKRVYELMKSAGVTMTAAGATFPNNTDPRDRNLRIAPTYPGNGELRQATDILCLCAKIAAAEKSLNSTPDA